MPTQRDRLQINKNNIIIYIIISCAFFFFFNPLIVTNNVHFYCIGIEHNIITRNFAVDILYS